MRENSPKNKARPQHPLSVCPVLLLMETADLIDSSYRLVDQELEKFKALAGDGLFRFSVGREIPMI